jgi:hypothetical protein
MGGAGSLAQKVSAVGTNAHFYATGKLHTEQ